MGDKNMTSNGVLSRYQELFPDETSKAAAFDKIAECYFNRNFGRMSKSDLETLLFHLYIEQCLALGKPYDDYTLSKALGLTQSRIQTLKIKKELQYPHESFDWKTAFIRCIPNAYYDEAKHLVKVHIPDVNVLLELRHHLESHGWYDEYQLNPKLFQCQVDIFIAICQSLEDEKAPDFDQKVKESLETLQRSANDEEKPLIKRLIAGSAEDGLKDIAICASKKLLVEILGLLPFGGVAKAAIEAFIEIIEKS